MKNQYCVVLVICFITQSMLSMDEQNSKIAGQVALFNPTKRVNDFLQIIPTAPLKVIRARLMSLTPTERKKMFISVNAQQEELLEIVSLLQINDVGAKVMSRLLDTSWDDAKTYYSKQPFCEVLQAKIEMGKFSLALPMKNGDILPLQVPHYMALPHGGAQALANAFKKQEIYDYEKSLVTESLQQVCNVENQQCSGMLPIGSSDFSADVSFMPSQLDRLGNLGCNLLLRGPRIYPVAKSAGGFLLGEVIKIAKSDKSNNLLPLALALSENALTGQEIPSAVAFLLLAGTKMEDIPGIVAMLYLVAMTANIDKSYVAQYKNDNKWQL